MDLPAGVLSGVGLHRSASHALSRLRQLCGVLFVRLLRELILGLLSEAPKSNTDFRVVVGLYASAGVGAQEDVVVVLSAGVALHA